MRPTRHRRHSTTFKLELVRAYLNGEGGYKTIASKHDISHALLMIWVEKYQAGELSEEIENTEKISEYEAKIAALERKVGQLVMEIDELHRQPTRPLSNITKRFVSSCSTRRGRFKPHG